MKNNNFIMLSSDDWGWKTSKYQLATRFSENNKVLFVSSVGFRNPTVHPHDLKRIVCKIYNFFRGVRSVQSNLFVLTPLIIPFRNSDLVAKFNSFILKLQIQLACQRLGMSNCFLFVFSQNWYEIVKNIKCKKIIYYCVDDQAAFAGLDEDRFRKQDEQVAKLSDVIFCSSKQLYKEKLFYNNNTFYLPHGVNYQLFSRAIFDDTLSLPLDASQLKKPIIGFYGHISYDWVDEKLLKFIASARPHWTILLLGRYSMEVDEFNEFKNIIYMGEKDFRLLPSYCKLMDVGIIPFVSSRLTYYCNPLKLYEYLAAGLPVVSTDIPEVRGYVGEDIRISITYDEFVASCELALSIGDPLKRQARSKAMANGAWENRIDKIFSIIQDK